MVRHFCLFILHWLLIFNRLDPRACASLQRIPLVQESIGRKKELQNLLLGSDDQFFPWRFSHVILRSVYSRLSFGL